MKQTKWLLRVAAIAMLLHTIGHTIGALTWTSPPNPKVGAVITGMQTEHFDFMGSSVTLARFYNGYGITMIFVLLFVSLLLWTLASSPILSYLIITGIFLICLAVSECIYFFPFAGTVTSIAAICVWLGYINVLKDGRYQART